MLSAATQANDTPALSARSIIATATRRLGGEVHVVGHVSGTPAIRLVGPAPGQVELAIGEGVAAIGHVGGEHADLAVGDLACRAGVLPLHPGNRLEVGGQAAVAIGGGGAVAGPERLPDAGPRGPL